MANLRGGSLMAILLLLFAATGAFVRLFNSPPTMDGDSNSIDMDMKIGVDMHLWR
jgi:hypothetical protein